jgi:uncharacterized Tic20 family protein
MPASADPHGGSPSTLAPHSGATDAASQQPPPGQGLAILAESLFLANLLVLPGLSFLALAWLFLRHARTAPALAQNHLYQAFSASLWAGVLLVLINLVIILLGGYRGIHTWVIVILYFTFVHSTLVIVGMVGLAKAMSGQSWTMPLFGRFPLIASASPGAR